MLVGQIHHASTIERLTELIGAWKQPLTKLDSTDINRLWEVISQLNANSKAENKRVALMRTVKRRASAKTPGSTRAKQDRHDLDKSDVEESATEIDAGEDKSVRWHLQASPRPGDRRKSASRQSCPKSPMTSLR